VEKVVSSNAFSFYPLSLSIFERFLSFFLSRERERDDDEDEAAAARCSLPTTPVARVDGVVLSFRRRVRRRESFCDRSGNVFTQT
jgi:hypothetical protein